MTGDLATHLRVALAAHLAALARNGMAPPAGLDVLVAVADALSSGQDRSTFAPLLDCRHPEPDPKVHTLQEVSILLGCSLSTVRRMVTVGVLPTIKVGVRGVRVPAAAVEDYLAAVR